MPVAFQRVTGVRSLGRRFPDTPRFQNGAATGSGTPAGGGSSGGGASLTMYNSAIIYGPGIAVESKGNLPVDNRDVAIRFVPRVSSTITSVTLPWRWGAGGYSSGNAGSFTVSIQSDDGTASHKPSGTSLASVSYTPSAAERGLSDTRYKVHTFSSPPSVTAGTRYHIVVHNTAATPTGNYTSINMALRAYGNSGYGGSVPSPVGTAQAMYTDEFATLYGSPVSANIHTPVVDILYGDSSHDGNPYCVSGCGTGPQSFGGTTMVRQRFTKSGSTLSALGLLVRPKLISGSGALTVDFRTTGSSVESFTIPAASFTTLAAGCTGYGEPWLGGSFSTARAITSGTSYEVRMSCAAGTTYRLESPLLDESSASGALLSAAYWTDRLANPEVSTDSGSNWNVIYGGFTNDMPFYFTLA